MRAVEVVLEHQLPVAVVDVLEHAARDFQLAAGRAVDEVVEGGLGGSKEFQQIRSGRGQGSENEPAIGRDARHGFQSGGQAALLIAGLERHGAQHARRVVAPAVIGAHEAFRIALALRAHHRSAVRAAIDQHRDLVIFFFYDNYGFPPHARGEVVAGVLDLALVAEHQPGAAEDARHLEREDFRVGVHAAVHAVGLHQHGELLVRGHAMIVAVAHLHADEIAHYQREGWVVPRYRLPPARVAAMVQALEQLLRDNPGVRPEKLVSAHIEGDNGEGVRGSRAFLELALDPQIVELVSGVLGDDVILWGCHVFCKPAVEGYETPWHQDGHYWPIRPLATCTAWVALEPSTVANGCLRVIPRSHARRRLYEHLHEERTDLTLSQRTAAGAFDEAQAVDIELEPGQMSLHDVYMIHGAKPNTSGMRRTGAALRYMPSTSVFDRQLRPVDGKSGVPVDFARRPLWLVRGVDRSGRNDLRTGHGS